PVQSFVHPPPPRAPSPLFPTRRSSDLGIPVGPGRGSAAGSLIAYVIGITDIDPLQFGLLFERFLNPDRISPPDIDVDFCEARRGDRKSTRLNSSHRTNSYAVFCLKKKN